MKILFILIFITQTLFAITNSDKLRVQIIEKIINEISLTKDKKVWSDNQNILYQLKYNDKLQVTYDCKDATILILENKKTIEKECEDKHIFVLNYQLLKDIPKSFGALFWKKGRPNIIIINPRINLQAIRVSNNLKPYLEDKVW